jgi:hypothetical protein
MRWAGHIERMVEECLYYIDRNAGRKDTTRKTETLMDGQY